MFPVLVDQHRRYYSSLPMFGPREHSEINMAATQVLRKWKIFGAECPIPTQRLKICKDWEDRARISPIFSTLHPGRLSFILEMYWGANHMNLTSPFGVLV